MVRPSGNALSEDKLPGKPGLRQPLRQQLRLHVFFVVKVSQAVVKIPVRLNFVLGHVEQLQGHLVIGRDVPVLVDHEQPLVHAFHGQFSDALLSFQLVRRMPPDSDVGIGPHATATINGVVASLDIPAVFQPGFNSVGVPPPDIPGALLGEAGIADSAGGNLPGEPRQNPGLH